MSAEGVCIFFFFSSRRRHTRLTCDWSSDVCSSDLLLQRAARERRPTGRVAEPELPADVLAEAAAGEVLARKSAGVAVPQHAFVEDGRPFEQLLEPLAPFPFLGGLGRDLLVLDLDAEAAGEELDRTDEVDLLELLDERDRVAALAAAEALERAARGSDDEARRALLMERAQALVDAAGLAQPDVVLDEREDLRRGLHLLDRGVLDARHSDGARLRRRPKEAATHSPPPPAAASAKRSVMPAM